MNIYAKHIYERLQKWHTSEDNVRLLYDDIRLYFEHKKDLNNSYPALHFFANWRAHTKLDLTRAISLLKEITVASHKFDLTHSSQNYPQIFIAQFFIDKPKQEMKELFNKLNISWKILNNNGWIFVCYHLMYFLINKPVELPITRNKKLLKKIYELKKYLYYFDNLTINEQQIEDKAGFKKGDLIFKMEMKSDKKLLHVIGKIMSNPYLSI